MWASSALLSPARQRQLMEAALDALDAQVAIIDVNGTFVYLSNKWYQRQQEPDPLLTAELGGNVRTDGIIGHADVIPALRDALTQVWQRRASHFTRQVHIGEGDATRWLNLEVHRLEDGEVMVLLRDITIATAREHDLRTQATRDPVTELANRRLAWQVLDTHVRAVRNGKASLAVLVCDLDEFKEVNDQFGHAAGDEVLRAVARRWSTVVRTQDLLARIGGDEFLVIVPGLADILDIHAMAGRLTGALAEPIHIGRASVSTTASVGGVFLKPGCANASTEFVTERADRALYVAKRDSDQHIHIIRMNHVQR
ncbi:MAG: hypothetical protein RL745_281 [Actinomycetota bacterium]